MIRAGLQRPYVFLTMQKLYFHPALYIFVGRKRATNYVKCVLETSLETGRKRDCCNINNAFCSFSFSFWIRFFKTYSNTKQSTFDFSPSHYYSFTNKRVNGMEWKTAVSVRCTRRGSGGTQGRLQQFIRKRWNRRNIEGGRRRRSKKGSYPTTDLTWLCFLGYWKTEGTISHCYLFMKALCCLHNRLTKYNKQLFCFHVYFNNHTTCVCGSL